MRPFNFKQFKIHHEQSFKVGTDGVLLASWVDVGEKETILDIGSGSGLIPLILAQRNKKAQIIGVEIDSLSYEESIKNVAESPWKDRVHIHHNTIQNFSTNTEQFYDLIISNPPFFNNAVKSANKQKAVARHTDKLPFQDIINVADKHLTATGSLAVILPNVEGELFISQAEQNSLFLTKKIEVRSKKDKPVERLLMEFSKVKQELQIEELVIQFEERNHFTPDYIKLTKDFYTIM